MRLSTTLFAGLLSLAAKQTAADPTWPASTDEIEEIIYQLQGFRTRLFSGTITPCSHEASGPGRQNAAEWLRVGFHDMSTANTFFGTGGLDASLQFELLTGENSGPGHNTTLTALSNYLSTRASMADLIAAGVYASVRSCGGPIIPLRLGRVDATAAGSLGVPQPQNSVGTFVNQFQRMGFSIAEMIQLTACGHTLGGVHTTEFPDLVPAGTGINGEASMDSTVAAFDNKVVTEYISGNTSNPLIVGPSIAVGRNSDFKVFNADSNVTMKAMQDSAAFNSVCQTVLQKMIEVVPPSVTLTTDPISPYTIKPVDMQLSLNSGGTTLLLSGWIRVRTTNMPIATITSLTLTWKDRSGGNACGSVGTCSTTVTVSGAATGFDDSFGFFPISTNIDASKGISSFTVTLNMADGTTKFYDNNGNSYPLTDAVILQKPSSCLLQGTGALTVTALVRNDRSTLPMNLGVSYLVPRGTRDGNPVPAINNATVAMTAGACVGSYTLYTASYTITGGLSPNARIDVISGSGTNVVSDDFNLASDLFGTCTPFSGAATCASVNVTTSTTTVASSTTKISTSTSSTVPTGTLGVRPTIGGYNFVGCYTEGTGVRALSGATFAYDGLTLESCMANCTGFTFWGAEYGRECYCGNSLAASSSQAALTDCNMVCSGDATEYCGAGNRLELYVTSTYTSSAPTSTPTSSFSTSVISSTSSSTVPTGTLSVKPTVGKYSFVGCQTEATDARALSATTYADDGMTLESCAAFCSNYKYFGTEYGRECYCGDTINTGSIAAPLSDCSMVCAGNPYEYCGAGNRLELYSVGSVISSSASSSIGSTLVVSSSSSTKSSSSSSSQSSSSTSSKPSSSSSKTSSSMSTSKSSSTSFSTSTTKSSSTSTSKSISSTASTVKTSSSSTKSSSSSTKSSSSSSIKSTSTSSTKSTSSSSTKSSSTNTVSTKATSSSTSSSTTSTVPSSTLAVKPTVSPYAFVGCWTEGTAARALSAKSYTSATNMTLENCAAYCSGYKYFGTEYGQECYCGDSLDSTSASAPLTDCSMTCTGNPYEYCGAGNRLELYTANVTVPAGPSQPAKVGAWSFYNCMTEATAGRALSSTSTAADTMTLELCAEFCAGYTYFGTEYGRECYCGSTFGAGSIAAPGTDCSMTCAGNSSEYCGAGNRLSVYSK